MITNAASLRNTLRRTATRRNATQRLATMGESLQATVEERRRCMKEIFDEWEQNRVREVADDDRADDRRAFWGE